MALAATVGDRLVEQRCAIGSFAETVEVCAADVHRPEVIDPTIDHGHDLFERERVGRLEAGALRLDRIGIARSAMLTGTAMPFERGPSPCFQ